MRGAKRFSLLIFGCVILVGLTLLYFAYYRIRRRVVLYSGVSLVKTINIQSPYFWVPQWVDTAIAVGDKDINPLGGTNAEVIDKESVEAVEYGRYVSLLLNVEATKDRSGVYLFKNKPLAVGSIVQLRFPKTSVFAYIQSIDEQKPNTPIKHVRVVTRFKEIEPFMDAWIKIGNEVINNKGETIAKVVDKTSAIARREVHTASGTIAVGANPLKRDVDVVVELLVKELAGNLYFADTYKIKQNESVFIPWPSGHLNHYIIEDEPST